MAIANISGNLRSAGVALRSPKVVKRRMHLK